MATKKNDIKSIIEARKAADRKAVNEMFSKKTQKAKKK